MLEVYDTITFRSINIEMVIWVSDETSYFVGHPCTNITSNSYIKCMFFSSSTRNFIGLLLNLFKTHCVLIIRQLYSGPSYILLFTAFWFGARADHTCDLCVFQNLHLTHIRTGQSCINNLMDFLILIQGDYYGKDQNYPVFFFLYDTKVI